MPKNLTRSGVCYQLAESPWVVQRHDLQFHFSSYAHKSKFMEQVREKEDWLCDSLSRRFHVEVDAKLIACIQLYLKIELRGVYIKTLNGEVFRCQEEIRLDGMRISRQG